MECCHRNWKVRETQKEVDNAMGSVKSHRKLKIGAEECHEKNDGRLDARLNALCVMTLLCHSLMRLASPFHS